MTVIRSKYATINGVRREVGRTTYKFEERHFKREPETPKGLPEVVFTEDRHHESHK